jgi:hypothetical protein
VCLLMLLCACIGLHACNGLIVCGRQVFCSCSVVRTADACQLQPPVGSSCLLLVLLVGMLHGHELWLQLHAQHGRLR